MYYIYSVKHGYIISTYFSKTVAIEHAILMREHSDQQYGVRCAATGELVDL